MTETLAICNVATSGDGAADQAHVSDARRHRDWSRLHQGVYDAAEQRCSCLRLPSAKLRGHLPAPQKRRRCATCVTCLSRCKACSPLNPNLRSSRGPRRFAGKGACIVPGPRPHFPIALEGGAQAQGMSYIHGRERMQRGELKHGPLALVTDQMPVVTVATETTHYWKSSSRTFRKCVPAAVSSTCSPTPTPHIVSSDGIHVIRMPENYGALSPILHVVPLQLLAYHKPRGRSATIR